VEQSLQIDFWLSRTSLGASETVFHRDDTIYFNCTLLNLTNDTLGWGMHDAGPGVDFEVRRGGEYVIGGPEGKFLSAPTGRLAPGARRVAQWYALNDSVLTPGKYEALALPYISFFGLGAPPERTLNFTIEE
jgi:hypothetical protein